MKQDNPSNLQAMLLGATDPVLITVTGFLSIDCLVNRNEDWWYLALACLTMITTQVVMRWNLRSKLDLI
jgi:hypothetical protein